MLVESTQIKFTAFQALYRDEGEEVIDAITRHYLANEGISRVEKIRHCHSEYLGVDLSEDDLARWAEKYSRLVVDAVVDCEAVPGSVEFLEETHERIPIFVISGTPENELIDVVARRQMGRYFTSVHGSPRRKTPIVADLLEKHSLNGAECLFVGDAMADYRAAQENALQFIGRVTETQDNPFPPNTTIVRDLRELTV